MIFAGSSIRLDARGCLFSSLPLSDLSRSAMTLRLSDIRDLAYRFVPPVAADARLYEYGCRSWWPAHEIGHFLVATLSECHRPMFGIDAHGLNDTCPRFRYVLAKEIAATSISQRLLRRAGHRELAVDEIELTDEKVFEYASERRYRRAVYKLLRENKAARLPTTRQGLESLLTRKAQVVGTLIYTRYRVAKRLCRGCKEINANENCPVCAN